ncbi:citrate synthase family protein [Cohaesibacter sp. CAU 1516]|uniref:citrate synthase family protein n=1 Tax=Cohaesibacter sp. CAU 1516 TaxID=2576038 RepID=UPI001485BEC1|nr:citrate synthase family protein [Cohaesibacter sp. CAU 1516]
MAALYMTAKEAAAELGVRVETLYSYVSRGFIRSQAGPGRSRLYASDDVRAMRMRNGDAVPTMGPEVRDSGDIIRSSLTYIDEAGPHYCGRSAIELAQHGTLEATATLLWDCGAVNPFNREKPRRPIASAPAALRPVERAMVMLSAWPLVDRSAYALHPSILWAHGVDLCRLVASELVNVPPDAIPIADLIAKGWGVDGATDRRLISMALVLSADHELNSSAYAVRVAASTGAPLHAAIVAGMGAFLGPKHGAASERVDHWFEGMVREADPALALEKQLMRAEDLPGFGHLLYTNTDPRGKCLMDAIRAAHPDHSDVLLADQVIDQARTLFGIAPNIDFSLALMKRVLKLPEGAGMVLFCAGRMVGWIGHALEQFKSGAQIRPRALYVGPKGI